MYYSSNKNNSDYYNTYKQEMEEIENYENEISFQKVIKIGMIILSIGLITILIIHFTNSFSVIPKESISINSLPETIQNKDNYDEDKKITKVLKIKKKATITPRDVAIIVATILSQMNQKSSLSLENQLLSSPKNKHLNNKTLKESNHYNKVVISNTKEGINPLETIVDSKENDSYSEYEEAIKKELGIRSNEMRIIVVRKGDNLSKIAKKAYGNINAYHKIFKANPEVLKNPNQIYVGQKLRIPA